jgi:CHAT domain-containing protein/tetratricopeptide (TPR) repeat protein
MGSYQDVVSWENQASEAEASRQYQEAIQAHRQAIEATRSLDRPRLLTVLYNRLGVTLEAGNQIQEAVSAYESGLRELAREPGSDLGPVLASIRSTAKGYDAPGPASLGVPDLYTPAMADDLKQAEADRLLAVKLLINIGNAYLRQPQDDPALGVYRLALQRGEIVSAPALRAQALSAVGIIERRRGETLQAEKNLGEAIQLLDQAGNPLDKRRALAALAGIYRDRGDVDRALATYQQALDLYEQAGDPLGEGRARAGLGHLYLQQKQYDEARGAFQQAVDLAQQTQDEDTLWHAYWGLGRCLQVAGELDAAAGALQRCLELIQKRQQELCTDEGKVTFLEGVKDILNDLIAVHLDRAGHNANAYADALDVAEEIRGRAMHELMGGRRQLSSRQAGFREVRRRPHCQPTAVQEAPGVMAMVAQMAPAVQPVSAANLLDLLQDAVLDEGAASPADGDVNATPGSPETTEAPIPVPLPRLVFHVLSDRTAILAVGTDGSVRGQVTALGHDALAGRVAAVRAALGVDNAPRGIQVTRDVEAEPSGDVQEDHRPLLRSLYAELIEPVAAALPSDGTPVVVEPHGPLWLLPFAALLAPDGSVLADRWPLLYSPSAQVLDEIRHEPDYGGPQDLEALLVGNPQMPTIPQRDRLDITLRSLPGAEEECRGISDLFGGARATLLLGKKADWAHVVAQMAQHGIVHLATHGIAYADDPLASFVALGVPDERSFSTGAAHQEQTLGDWLPSLGPLNFALDEARHGMLTARQILYLPLPADLVTLSACQTGLGRVSGEGMIGLSRSFLVAGARSVLVSLWSVSDAATAELMAHFYQGYIELDDKAIALQRAMQALRQKAEYDHPRYWAPFVVVGAEA